jgi:hypothetical protein
MTSTLDLYAEPREYSGRIIPAAAMASPSLHGLVVAVALTVGCSHKEAYVEAKGLYAADLDDIASYASLLDAKQLGDADGDAPASVENVT